MNFVLALLAAWTVNSIALGLTAALVPGVKVDGIKGALYGALGIGLVSSLVKPVVAFFSIPFMLLTLGLFYFVVIAFCFWAAAKLAPGFEVDGLGSGLLGAAALSIVNWGLSFVVATPSWW